MKRRNIIQAIKTEDAVKMEGKVKKRFLFLMMCLVLVISALPVNSLQAARKVRPAVPALTVSTSETGQAKLSWKAVEGATGYRIYRKTDGETSHSKFRTTTKTTYTDVTREALKRGSKVSYRIRSFYKDASGKKIWSSFSDPVTWTNPRKALDPTKPIIALSFDDGPSIYTPDVLKMLAENGASATFFMVGYNIDRYGNTVKLVHQSGCEVGNHSVNHPNLNTLTKEKIQAELDGNLKKINRLIGDGKRIIRPPYGNANDTVKSVAGAPLIYWTDDTRDWDSRNAQSVLKEVQGSARDGYIILMHDIYQSSYEGACLVVPWLIKQGYQVCSVSEMFEARGVALTDGVMHYQCINAAKYKEQNGIK